jgi:hypothetical protein
MNKVLSNGWKEAEEQRIRLLETQAATLEVYLHWMYTGHLIVELTQTESVSLQCVKLYILGDYLSDTVFCEAVVEKMVDRSQERKLPCARAITLVWDSTPENSGIPNCSLFACVRVYIPIPQGRTYSHLPHITSVLTSTWA